MLSKHYRIPGRQKGSDPVIYGVQKEQLLLPEGKSSCGKMITGLYFSQVIFGGIAFLSFHHGPFVRPIP